MKKLLSLLAATGLVATSGSVAVACNKADQNSLTYVEGKSDKDVVEILKNEYIKDNKLIEDYKDFDGDLEGVKFKTEGKLIPDESKYLMPLFNNTKDIKSTEVSSDEKSTTYRFFSIKGAKDDIKFDLIFLEYTHSEGVASVETKTLFKTTVNIPQG
ncbi:hypothetical protein SHELI_v1c09390 [Spiroplasma helicoides]|uniref:Lipoprotein n=1 Tax=Spiroplasma helicoides TaxID=216938 RepID=A0A1B3SLT2_9MOLU|nr:lipoprotein [Spiroplasma helicoides]AOG60888.1 hypothetical protein SHELI_v1c09390 [Spiroplasma helicoides]